MVELRILGATELRRDDRDVDSFLTGPKRLGLLVYLVLARPRGFQRRDAILPLFWPQRGQKAARNALSNMLYHIRRELGADVITNRGAEEVGVQMDGFWCDAVAFEEALDQGDAQQALTLYRGDLLKGFYVPDAAPAFHDWLDRERERLRLQAAEGAWRLAEEAEQTGRRAAARERARQAAGFTPFSDEAQQRLIMLLDRLGSRASALSAYEAFAARLRREWEMEPTDEVKALVEGLHAPSREGTASSSRVIEAGRASSRSIAVLPFETLGAAQASAFADGIHGDLVTRLSNVADLQVISRTSVRRYRNTDKPISTIGAELNTPWVLEGEVQEVAEQVQVNVRLVHAQADQQVWARDYRRALTAENLFHIQGEITKEIVRSLEATLTPEEEEQVERSPTGNLDAYRLYVLGRKHLDERTEEDIYQAVDYFQRATEQDAEYALAWAGLGDGLSLLEFYGFRPPDAAPEPMEAAHRAVALAPNLGEARAALGIRHALRHEGPEALCELGQAIELAPSHAEAWIWLGWVQLCLGRPAQAPEPAERAVALDPLAPAFRVYLAEIYLANGTPQHALREARRARELQPKYGLAHFMEGLVLYHQGRLVAAASSLRQALSLIPPQGTPTHAEVRAALALAHVVSGDDLRARELLDQIDGTDHPFSAGLVRAALGETDAAFDAFEQIHDWGSFETEHVRYFFPRALGPLRDDARYESLIQRVNQAWGLHADGSLPENACR
ncbi:MAG: hypothetical protein GVY18_18815 [Bacteroidetes bacterium]|jgi:TolB-like protein/Flp pilus assembly protein TadD|nr:hypothetical protein [Bacteroidota bacterium]